MQKVLGSTTRTTDSSTFLPVSNFKNGYKQASLINRTGIAVQPVVRCIEIAFAKPFRGSKIPTLKTFENKVVVYSQSHRQFNS